MTFIPAKKARETTDALSEIAKANIHVIDTRIKEEAQKGGNSVFLNYAVSEYIKLELRKAGYSVSWGVARNEDYTKIEW